MKLTFSYRRSCLAGLLIVIFLLSFVYYLEKYDGFNPCPLCVLQRFVILALGVLFLLGAVLNIKYAGRVIFSLLASLASLGGIALAGRQVWLQHIAPLENENCAMSLQYLVHVLPLNELIKTIFQGTSECSKAGWSFLRLSLAEWALLWFLFFLFLSLLQLRHTLRSKSE